MSQKNVILGKKRPGESLVPFEDRYKKSGRLIEAIQEQEKALPPKDVEILKMMSSMEFQLQSWVCNLCDKDITESVKIVSAVCSGNGKLFVYCLQCLQKRKPGFSHTPQDAYYVMDRLNFPLFSRDFSAREELALVQGLMKMGMDNFVEIAE